MSEISALQNIEKQFIRNHRQAKKLLWAGAILVLIGFGTLIFYSLRFERQNQEVKQEINASAAERERLKQIINDQGRTLQTQAAKIKIQDFQLTQKDSILRENHNLIIKLIDEIRIAKNSLLNADSEGIELNRRFSPTPERP